MSTPPTAVPTPAATAAVTAPDGAPAPDGAHVPAGGPVSGGRSPRRRRLTLGIAAVGAFAAVTTAVFGAGFGRNPAVVASTLVNKPAPPLRGITLGGIPLDLSSYRGKVLLVNVWASWCAPCRAEHPVLAAAQRDYARRGLQIVGIDMSDKPADARRFLTDMGGAAYPSVQDPHAEHAIAWGTFGVPETYLVDREGIVREKAVGAVTPDWILATVVPVLATR